MKSTHGLEALTGSCVGEISALSQFRKTLLADRARARDVIKQEEGVIAVVEKKQNPLTIAKEKISKASLSYIPGGDGNANPLTIFRQMKEFTRVEFLDLLKRSLNIVLTGQERDAFIDYFVALPNSKSDPDKIGMCILYNLCIRDIVLWFL